MRKAMAVLAVSFFGWAMPASAATIWMFDGNCVNSRLKIGLPADDLTMQPGDPISCKSANLMELQYGRVLVNFVTGTGVLGFAGSGFDSRTNPKLLLASVDRIHPVRDFGSDAKEILRRSGNGEGVLNDAEGVCIFEPKNLAKVTSFVCVGNHVEPTGLRRVYTVEMRVKKVTKNTNFPDF